MIHLLSSCYSQFRYTLCVWWMLLTAINIGQIETMVLKGDRPSLDAIKGPAELVSFATRWIPLCWHESPDERPTFDGKYTVSQKNKQNYFCYNYVKLPSNLTIFGTMIANCLKLYEVHSFSTSPNSLPC